MWKPRKAPAKPTRSQVQAALNAQRPLDDDAVEYRRKKPRRWVEDSVDDVECDDPRPRKI